MAVAISRALYDELLARAAADPQREVCGLLFGAPNRIDAIQPCTNVSPSSHDSFEIDPAALIAAHKAERAGGPRLIGCYHSHPNAMTPLSDRDLACYVAGQLWLIVAAGSVHAWQPHRIALAVADPQKTAVLRQDRPFSG